MKQDLPLIRETPTNWKCQKESYKNSKQSLPNLIENETPIHSGREFYTGNTSEMTYGTRKVSPIDLGFTEGRDVLEVTKHKHQGTVNRKELSTRHGMCSSPMISLFLSPF